MKNLRRIRKSRLLGRLSCSLRRDLSRFLAFYYDPFRHYHPRHVVNPTS